MVSIHLPPLRERRQDIPSLARFFLERYSEENRRDAPHLSDEVMKVLMTYDWPGNVRELENCIERAVVLANGKSLTPDLLASSGQKERRLRLGRMKGGDLLALIQHLVRAGIHSLPTDEGRLYDRLVGGVERELIEQVMQQCDNVQVKAAARLGINRNTLHKKLSEFAGPEARPPEPGTE